MEIDRFDENYALASTQSLKNKDIPEGGAKGTILPSYASTSILAYYFMLNAIYLSRLGASPRLCFEKYVDVSCLYGKSRRATEAEACTHL
jgi:glutamate dehydrogenase